MKPHYLALIGLGLIFSLMIGSFLFGISLGFLPKENVIQDIEKLYESRGIAFFFAIFLFSMSYVVTKTVLKKITTEEIFLSENEFGRVSISLSAVETVLKQVIRKYPQIKRYRAHFQKDGKKLSIQIRIKEWEGDHVSATINEINNAINHKLDNISGLKDHFDLVVKVEKIISPLSEEE